MAVMDIWDARADERPTLTARRRRVVGIDLSVEAPRGASEAVDFLRLASSGTHLRLAAAVDSDGAEAAGEEPTVVRARFVARDPEAHLTDTAIAELLAAFVERVRWYALEKLEEFDGIEFFAPIPR